VKRVVFLGGGDNMILHEILKFPELELVVGMELDQQVIRSSFQHLGTLPYFDDDRVQWWFGDATKSLFALPEEYYGSFDLVLVDLQTFVADVLKVTDKLSIMETAMLLMKQDGGVIAKNEDFPDRTNVGFAKYTVDLEYHDVPHICMQSITMGSNSIDFMTATSKYHTGVETLAVDLVGQPKKTEDDSESDPFHAWYAYRQSTPPRCETDPGSAGTSPGELADPIGVMVIVEAENVSMTSLGSLTGVKKALSMAIKDLNLSEIAISSEEDVESKVAVFVLAEGYITARVFAQQRYIAFDLMLWDCLDRVDNIKQTLVEAMGGSMKDMNTSSFRFVSSGMSGLEQCQKNVITQVAAQTNDSICSSLAETGSAVDEAAMKSNASFVHEVLQDLVLKLKPSVSPSSTESAVAVFCGSQELCPVLNAMEDLAVEAGNMVIVPFHACKSLDDMPACHEKIASELASAVAANKKFDIVVLDVSVPFKMGQIIDKIFSDKVTYGKTLEESQLLLTPVPAGQSWRTKLLDQFRTDLALFDPAHRANVRFHKENEYIEWCIFSSGDHNFFRFLSSAIAEIEKKTGWKPSVEEVTNGIINEIVDFSPPKVFKDSDYEKTRAFSQWKSQTPVGHQTLYQMALLPPKTPVELEERILAEHEPGPWDMRYGGAVVKRVIDNDTYSVLYDGEEIEDVITRGQIRKFSPADHDMTTTLEVGDLIFYNNPYGILQNGVISKVESDGTYSIYLLNTSGEKKYGIPRNQLIHQFESTNYVESVPDLSVPVLKAAFETALRNTILKDSSNPHTMQSFMVGGGVVITVFWSQGHGILKWDGLKRVDINLFTYTEDIEGRIAFQNAFVGEIDYMNGVARDEHPRGYGRIVNFANEMKTPPQWAQ
jgi:Spermine/spermidine synthase domain